MDTLRLDLRHACRSLAHARSFSLTAWLILTFGIGLSTAVFSLVLAVLFVTWFRAERTLSIHSIFTFRRELFYWAVVMATFALGTAAGDMTAFSLGWGFFTSAVLFGALFGAAFVARWRFGVGEVAAFWFAYIVTRPLGASLADLFAAPKTLGGLGYGYGTVSVILAIAIAACVAYLAIARPDVRALEAPDQRSFE